MSEWGIHVPKRVKSLLDHDFEVVPLGDKLLVRESQHMGIGLPPFEGLLLHVYFFHLLVGVSYVGLSLEVGLKTLSTCVELVPIERSIEVEDKDLYVHLERRLSNGNN
jgi:hypothetical protein